MTPNLGRLWWVRPIKVPKVGMPEMKLLVPSIGSMTHL